MPTRLHLVRHGHTNAIGNTLSGRTPEVALSERGRSEAQAAAAALGGCHVSAILSSPQTRAQQTASCFSAVLGLPVETSVALDEVEFGSWTGRSFGELDAEPTWRDWNNLRSLAPGGGETMLSVQARVVGLVQELRVAWPDAELVLVSHADVLRSLLAYVLGAPIDLMQRIEVSSASRSIVVLQGPEIRVEAVNIIVRRGLLF